MNLLNSFLFILLISSSMCAQSNSNVKESANKETQIEAEIYGSPDCHYCIEVKDLLFSKNVKYKFYDVDVSEENLRTMLSICRENNISTYDLNLPVVKIGNVVLVNTGDFKLFLRKIEVTCEQN